MAVSGDPLYVGAKSPQAVAFTVTPSTLLSDLSTVTSARALVTKPDGVASYWTCAITAQDAGSITLQHTLASDGSDADLIGSYAAQPLLSVGSSEYDCILEHFSVIARR